MSAVDSGPDALGEVTVLLELDGAHRDRAGRVDRHPRGVGPRVPARALERARELGGRRGRAPPRPGRARRRGASTLSFTWLDGERLIRFGAGRADEAAELLRARGFDGFALLTTERFRSHPLADAADAVVLVPPGPVPEASAAARGEVGGRPVVALGGGRVVDSAKAIGAADGLPGGRDARRRCRAPSSPASTGCPRGSRAGARAAVARDRRPGVDGVGADAAAGRERAERAGARGGGALHAAGEPGRGRWPRCARSD